MRDICIPTIVRRNTKTLKATCETTEYYFLQDGLMSNEQQFDHAPTTAATTRLVPAADRLRPASSPQTIDGVWLIIASRILFAITLATSCLVMVSWLTGWSEFSSLIPSLPTMKFNSALAFTLLASGGLLDKTLTTCGRFRKITADLLVLTALAIAVANLFQNYAGLDLGIDTLFFADRRRSSLAIFPGVCRMERQLASH